MLTQFIICYHWSGNFDKLGKDRKPILDSEGKPLQEFREGDKYFFKDITTKTCLTIDEALAKDWSKKYDIPFIYENRKWVEKNHNFDISYTRDRLVKVSEEETPFM